MFESHVTIEKVNKEYFIDICHKIGVKPVIIKDDTGSHITTQMMTAKFHKTDDLVTAISEMFSISECFDGVIRRKLEFIIPNSDEIPKEIKKRIKYFEYHLKYSVPKNSVDFFRNMVKECGGHSSRNIAKDTRNDYVFATAREIEVKHELIRKLGYAGFDLGWVIREAVIYDDNEDMDSNWRCYECPLKRIENYMDIK